MPSNVTRVRMPHNNRVSTSGALATSDIWSKTIGHDPYAAQSEQGAAATNEDEEKAKGLLALARHQKIAGDDTSGRDNFSQRLYLGLKKKKRRFKNEEQGLDMTNYSRSLLEENESSSEDEFIEVDDEEEEEKEEVRPTKSENKKKRKRSSSKKRKSKRSDDDDSSTSSSDDERRRRRDRKKRKRKRKHRKKHRKRYEDSNSSSSDSEEEYRKRRREDRKKRKRRGEESREKRKGSFGRNLLATGPDGTNGFQDGWTKRTSEYATSA